MSHETYADLMADIERREEAEQKKPVSDFFTTLAYQRLLNMTASDGEEDLPHMWGEIANAKKRQTAHQIIEENVTLVASESNRDPPCTQVGFQKYIHNVRLCGVSRSNLADGIGVMTVIPSGAMSQNALAMTVAIGEDSHSSRFLS